MSLLPHYLLFLLLGLLHCLPQAAQAATVFYNTSNVDACLAAPGCLWSNKDMWVNGNLPAPGDSVVILTDALIILSINDTVQVSSINSSWAVSLHVLAGGVLNVTTNISISKLDNTQDKTGELAVHSGGVLFAQTITPTVFNIVGPNATVQIDTIIVSRSMQITNASLIVRTLSVALQQELNMIDSNLTVGSLFVDGFNTTNGRVNVTSIANISISNGEAWSLYGNNSVNIASGSVGNIFFQGQLLGTFASLVGGLSSASTTDVFVGNLIGSAALVFSSVVTYSGKLLVSVAPNATISLKEVPLLRLTSGSKLEGPGTLLMNSSVLVSDESIDVANINIVNSNVSAPFVTGNGTFSIRSSSITAFVQGGTIAPLGNAYIFGNCSLNGYIYSENNSLLIVQGNLSLSGNLNITLPPPEGKKSLLEGSTGAIALANATNVTGTFSSWPELDTVVASNTTFVNGTLYYNYSPAHGKQELDKKELIIIGSGAAALLLLVIVVVIIVKARHAKSQYEPIK